MNRRKFITNSSLLAMGSTIISSKTNAAPEAKKDSLQVAFLSDIHVKATPASEAGMRKAFQHVNSLKQKPDFIINGGDAIMDAMAAGKAKTQEQWDVWNRVLNAENRLPVYHVIGNHDAWGWQVKDASIKTDPL
ncbi:MAG TPA: metallophosphoesterase family protein, partial [Hanamia sp.]